MGSVPRLQAQVADISNGLDSSRAAVPPFIHRASLPETAWPVPPAATAIEHTHDEFWRKVPLWEDVSVREFISYRWSVSPSCCCLASWTHG